MTPKKPLPHKRRGIKKGTKVTDKAKAEKAAHSVKGTGKGNICSKCGGKIPAHKLTCPTLNLPPRKK